MKQTGSHAQHQQQHQQLHLHLQLHLQQQQQLHQRVLQIGWLLCSLFLLLSTKPLEFDTERAFFPAGFLYVSAASHAHDERSLYYQRYISYPEYCSDPFEMKSRAIPPLPKQQDSDGNSTTATTTTYKSRLQHVTAIIRHGARTPIHVKNCWKGHWDAPDGIWDCPLKTQLTTRPYDSSHDQGAQISEDDKGQFVVEKVYDAFLGEKIPSPYRNTMNGTCQDGQLIQQGYDQQLQNGQYLRDAYVYDDMESGDAGGLPSSTSSSSSDPRLRLFTTSVLNDGNAAESNKYFLDGDLHFRSDDDQRTLASGQVLLSSMFGPEAEAYRRGHHGKIPIIAHHTADKDKDILSPYRGEKLCPKQQDVMRRGLASDSYHEFFYSNESLVMRQLIDDELEPEGVLFGGTDCMMTSMCTDRSIPDVIDDYKTTVDETNKYTKKYGPNRFERLRDYVIQNKTFISRFNDSELSKMDMGPLWAEMIETEAPFLLISGHDSTIYPLMTSLGERVWNATDFPPYASMMIIEFHEVLDQKTGAPPSDFPSGNAFRLVYNGKVMTWLMDGCPEYSHLCDISVFQNRVSEFATRKNHGCGVEEGSDGADESTSTLPQQSPEGGPDHDLRVLLGCMAASFILGSILTCLVMKDCAGQRPRRRQRHESQLVSSGKESSPDGFADEPDIIIS